MTISLSNLNSGFYAGAKGDKGATGSGGGIESVASRPESPTSGTVMN